MRTSISTKNSALRQVGATSPAERQYARRRPRPKILVVEDDQTLRDLNTAVLRGAGYEVILAKDGIEALRQMSAHRPDAMILDLNMPRLDGFGVLEALQTGERRPPTIVLSARHSSADIQRAIQLGASDYLAKPFVSDQLLARLSRLTRRRAARSAVGRAPC